jgi:O-antigen/teichoic acid export membrane protein
MLLTELDKLVISKQLSLEDFGYYSLGWQIAGSLYLASSPVFAALFPMFARKVIASGERELADAYHRAAQLMSLLVLPAASTFIFMAKPLIFAWTGNPMTAEHTWLTASLLTAGTAFNCTVSIPYAMQLAHGWTSLAFWSNLASTFVTIPLLLMLTERFGGPGAAAVWLMINSSYLATQVNLMHRRYLKAERWRWYFEDLGGPLIACVIVSGPLATMANRAGSRINVLLFALLTGGLTSGAVALATPLGRRLLREIIFAKRRALAFLGQMLKPSSWKQ